MSSSVIFIITNITTTTITNIITTIYQQQLHRHSSLSSLPHFQYHSSSSFPCVSWKTTVARFRNTKNIILSLMNICSIFFYHRNNSFPYSLSYFDNLSYQIQLIKASSQGPSPSDDSVVIPLLHDPTSNTTQQVDVSRQASTQTSSTMGVVNALLKRWNESPASKTGMSFTIANPAAF